MQPKKAIQQLQLAIGRAGYPLTVQQKRQYGHSRIFVLYTVYTPEYRKIISSYRPHEIALALSRLYKAIQTGQDIQETIDAIQAEQKAQQAAKTSAQTQDTDTGNEDGSPTKGKADTDANKGD